MKELIKPVIHLNGSDPQVLVDGYRAGRRAVLVAIAEVEAAGPDGRDYYPIGDGATARAINEHTDRLRRLREVIEELAVLDEHVQEQIDVRAARRASR